MISVRAYKLICKLWVAAKVTLGLGSLVAMIWAIQFVVTKSHTNRASSTQPNDVPLLPGQEHTSPASDESTPAPGKVRPTGDRQRSAEASAVLAQLTSPPPSNPPADSGQTSATMPSASRPPAVNAAAVMHEQASPVPSSEKVKGTSPSTSTAQRELEQPVSIQPLESSAPEVMQVKSILDQYRKQSGWWDRLKYVRSPGRVAGLAHHYYDVEKMADPALDKLVGAARFDLGDESFIQLAFLCPGRWSNTARVNFLLSATNDPQIDWESLVAFGEETWSEFVTKRIERPTLLRGYATLDDYYNYEFSDREKFISIRLRSPDGVQTLSGFAERNSPDGQRLAKMTAQLNSMLLDGPLPVNAGGPTVPATLRLAFPPKAQSDKCVRIISVFADRWVLTDAEELPTK